MAPIAGPSKMEILHAAGVFDENPEALHVERLQDHRGTWENAPGEDKNFTIKLGYDGDFCACEYIYITRINLKCF